MFSLLFSLNMTACAADSGFPDVPENAWYADAVEYVRDNGIMSGTSATTFSPDTTMTRAMLAEVLYRTAGSSEVSGEDNFTDTEPEAWYANAVLWASQGGLISGYGNGLFGTGDPVNREQIAVILWRYAGQPTAQDAAAFVDASSISVYAQNAVNWARSNGIISGTSGNRFDPKASATRAQVAVILRNYLTMDADETPAVPEAPSEGSRVLVAYFSATGSTERVAQVIADTLNADIFEIEPVNPYTSADLNYSNSSSRVCQEHEDPSLQDVELTATTPANWDEYDTVFIGYPIWWHAAAWPVNGFVTGNSFAGKNVVPFSTSASSGLGDSDTLLKNMAGTGNWLSGRNFFSRDDNETIAAWVNGLNIFTSAETGSVSDSSSKALVAYFSMPETTNPNDMTAEEANSTVVIDGEVLGNTQYMAYVIQETTDADIFRIEPSTPYPMDHTTLVAQAREEQSSDFRPVIRDTVSNMDEYDVIYLGYPNWWGDMPMILYSFLEQYDLSGKTIVPFNTHGGSGFSGTIGTIQQMEPQATVLDGMTISRDHIQDAEQEIVDWVRSLDF